MSLRLRLMLWNVGMLAFALTALGGILRARVQYHLQQGIDHELESRARVTRRWERFLGGRERPRSPGEPPLYTRDGRHRLTRQSAVDPMAVQQVFAGARPIKSTRGALRVYTIGLRNGPRGEVAAAYQITASLAPVRQELNKLTGELLALLPIGVLLAGVGGLFLTSRALRPIQAVTEAATQIEASDLSRRLEVKGKDELAQLSLRFNAMLGRLEEAFERQRRFTADASHELKTPLTTIKMAAGYGLTDAETPPGARALFARIDRATDRTIQLVGRLLTLARSDAQALVLEKEILPVGALFAAAREELERSPGPAIVLEEHGETLMGDRLSLEQVLLNLLDNALRHTPDDGTVTLAALPGGFAVRDTGAGIAPEHLPHLTERFYRVDSARARQAGGTGLGLAICKSIVEAHGGTLTIESEEGRGTHVQVLLP